VNSFPGFAPYVRGTRATGYITEPWAVAQEISAASPQDFNALALGSIARGLNALNIVVDRATRNGYDPDFAPASEVGTAGLSIASLADLERALNGVDLEKTFLFIRTGASALPFAALLAAPCPFCVVALKWIRWEFWPTKASCRSPWWRRIARWLR
jgi:methylmalonyl-CoA mutase